MGTEAIVRRSAREFFVGLFAKKSGARRSTLDRYLLSQLWISFFPLFGALFLIGSLISFVELSVMTAIVKITFSETLYLYFGQLPRLFLYILPIAFFAAVTTTLSRLSGDLETIVLFSLKASVWRVMRPFVPLAFFLAVGLLALGLVAAPKAQLLQKAMLFGKRDDAQINIRASEFGQKFGDWLLFVGSQSGENVYRDVALYSRPDGASGGFFVLAKSGEVVNNSGLLRLKLFDGRAYETGEETVRQMDYESMTLNETGRTRSLEYEGVINYWLTAATNKTVAKQLVWALLAAIFTVVSLPAAAIGIYSPRFVKNRGGAWAVIFAISFYAPAIALGDSFGALAFIAPPIWLAIVLRIVGKKLERF
jgi:lipopolysaccharide export system permease protein